MTKVGFVSLGCPKNLVDSEVMMGILAREGYELTARADEAEILVVNTCSFIEAAQKESVDAILEMAEHKKFGAAKKLIVAGCLVERYRAQILEQVPEVDAVVGTGEVERILEAVEGDLRVLPAEPPAFLYHDLTPRVITTPRHAAYIKIAEGCDHPCTFCIIPQLRGKFRSRRFESVVREAENLAASGAREITLIGQDMPLQHASRDVLARMKRGSHGDAFLKLLERIRGTIPGVTLRTSFIAGFPGETDADFEELCEFVKAAKLDWMGVFEYSDVDNAGSFGLDAKIDAETMSGRRDRLMAIQKKISHEKLRELKGRVATALVEGPSKDNPLVWEARLEGMAPDIDGKVYLTDIELSGGETATVGDAARVEITKTDAYDLVGRVVEILPRPAARGFAEAPATPPAETLTRISTGAALRVLG
jgi:ribosomal protein S12 methylthiotransferase